MMELNIDCFDICCNYCHEIINISKDELDIDSYSYNHGDNCMGVEVIYEINHEIECPNCGQSIIIHITGSEYPVGAYNNDDVEIEGATFVEYPHMDIIYYVCDYYDEPTINYTRVQKLIMDISNNWNLIYEVDPREFESMVNQLLKDEGFKTYLTKKTRDGGYDIVAIQEGIGGKEVAFYVECKRYNNRNKVNVNVIRQLIGVQTRDKINKVCIVTTSSFTKDAIEEAESQKHLVDLIDGDALQNMIYKSAKKYKSLK